MFSVMCVCLFTGVSMSTLAMMYLTLPYIDPLLQPLEHETSLHRHPLGSVNFGEEDLRPIVHSRTPSSAGADIWWLLKHIGMVGKPAVCILLECFIVQWMITPVSSFPQDTNSLTPKRKFTSRCYRQLVRTGYECTYM